MGVNLTFPNPQRSNKQHNQTNIPSPLKKVPSPSMGEG